MSVHKFITMPFGLLLFLPLLSVGQTSRLWNRIEPLHKTSDEYALKDIHRFYFINSTVGWAVGRNGIIQKTSDGGVHWSETSSPVSVDLNQVFFMDHLNGWAWSEKGPVIHTQNGGITWRILMPIETLNIHDLYFTDKNTGFMSTTEGVFKTSNAGQSWVPLSNFADDGFLGIQFIDAKNGWILHYYGVLKTTDGGLHWQFDSIHTSKGSTLTQMAFRDKNHGIICGSAPECVLHTSDGGQTWTEMPGMHSYKSEYHEEDHEEAIKLLYVNDNNIIAINSLNHMMRSTDKGQSWSEVPFHYKEIGVVDMQFTNLKEGIFYSFYNREFFATKDGGHHWTPLKEPQHHHLNDIFISEKTGYAVGDRGTILKSTNGGKAWQPLPSSISSNLQRVYFLNPENGWVLGDNSDVYYTTSGGKQWNKTILPLDIYVHSDSVRRVSNPDQAQCMNASDVNLCHPPCYQHTLEHIEMFNDNEGWIQGRVLSCDFESYTTLYTTKDGGKIWNQTPTYLQNEILDYTLINLNTIYAINKSRAFVSEDGGLMWKPIYNLNYCNSGSYLRIYKANDTFLAIVSQKSVISLPLTPLNGLATNNPGRFDFIQGMKKNQAQFFQERKSMTIFEKHSWDKAFLLHRNHVYSSNSICFGAIMTNNDNPLTHPVRSVFCPDRETVYITGKNGFIGKITENPKGTKPQSKPTIKPQNQSQNQKIKTRKVGNTNVIITRNGIHIY